MLAAPAAVAADPRLARRSAWWVVPAAVVLACVYLPSLGAWFDFADDGVTAWPEPCGSVADLGRQSWRNTMGDFRARGPFRPFVWTFWTIQQELLGGSPLAWRMFRLAWSALSAASLLWLLVELGFRPGPALAAAGLAWAVPYRGEIWMSLTYSEGVAMPFALLALVCAVRAARIGRGALGWDSAGLACLLVCLATKNVFAALAPAQLFLRACGGGLGLQEGVRRHGWRCALLALGLLLPAGHYVAYKRCWHPGYYSSQPSLAQLGGMARAVLGGIGIDFTAAGLGLAALVVVADRRRRGWREAVWSRFRVPVVAAGLLLAAGIAVYVPVGGLAGRYTVPAVWGVDILIAVLVTLLAEAAPGMGRRVAWTVLAGGLAALVVASVGRQERNAARNDLLRQVLVEVEARTAPGACVVWRGGVWPAVRPGELGVEEGYHFAHHLWGRGRKDLSVLLSGGREEQLLRYAAPWSAGGPPGTDGSPDWLVTGREGAPVAAAWRLVRSYTSLYHLGRGRYEARLYARVCDADSPPPVALNAAPSAIRQEQP